MLARVVHKCARLKARMKIVLKSRTPDIVTNRPRKRNGRQLEQRSRDNDEDARMFHTDAPLRARPSGSLVGNTVDKHAGHAMSELAQNAWWLRLLTGCG